MITVTARAVTGWDLVKTAALATIGKKYVGLAISDEWKRKILQAEHSPIRCLQFYLEIEMPRWVSDHFVRHSIGVTHFVKSQRDDRAKNPKPRAEMPQGTPTSHAMLINAQALINMARKRLCSQASPETREVMQKIVSAIYAIDPVMATEMKPDCEYRGGICKEMLPCGRIKNER